MIDLTDTDLIRRILREYRVFAQKKLGQHFLVDKNALTKIVAAAKLKSTDSILEIGPGLGTLTRALAPKVKQIVAVEKDYQMIRIFREINRDINNAKIVEANALMLPPSFFRQQFGRSYKLVANLPYYLTSAILRFFLQSKIRPAMMVVMVQQEVAERIIALPPESNLLSVAVQLYGQPEIVATVPRFSFWPAPKVDSAILQITPYRTNKYEVKDDAALFRVIKAGFGARRKQLHNSLSSGLHLPLSATKQILEDCGIQSTRRAQTLTIPEWLKLYEKIKTS
ncbi:ribosomal RNA small subunit methyltransferase A [candidate division Kazan bacterium RIFCSPHIGHO2_01_FULL_49_10]|uniref:Ribosomal RNA small subunit methyltransferase A n=1 Tax=candidate division Kazan bacterium RIFCSPLOWO2_01_FULL_48_13 TaxID=1798539 RepID=A0A1F4PN50_UNCK3|nr:MAG: ribosomal RNA small subunit methyltransferase A [candidate division Kazan bacterium RIFCSPHIGHO2_01_FULL_49_10]OGB85084.1 MAG: ribosomal RNA small subunit methyltransferase A [candidate division Kazan bacterium RIFCSPLOWO2_01_FULL_48_13]